MADIISFGVSVIGSSHIKSNKPCQDAVFHKKEDNGTYIAIACDGHGGETYVRSDRGSIIAAQVAYEKIVEFVDRTDLNVFLNRKGAVTAIPTKNPLLDKNGRDLEMKDLSESEQEIVKQNIQYVRSVESAPKHEKLFRELFDDINETWRAKITDDFNESPFTIEEKEALGDTDLVKAYGTTLLAFVRTPFYWFSFQIGDGKILCADRNFQWEEPVPWDHSCFLNYTTSLCEKNPVRSFRYAFDGTGSFPVAVTVGSDGIDDTFISKDSLHNFYSLLLCNFHEQGVEKTVKSLESYLPELSEKGSHDDMTIAGIVDLDALENGVKIFDINSKGSDLVKQRNSIKKEIKDLENQYTNLKEKLKELNNKIKEIKNEIDLNTNKKDSILKKLSITQKKLEDFSDMGKGTIEKLKESREVLVEKNNNLVLEDNKRWEEIVSKIEIEERKEIKITEKNKVDSLDGKVTKSEGKQTDEKTSDNEKYNSLFNFSLVKLDLNVKLLLEKSTVDYISSSTSLIAIEDKKNDKNENKENSLKSDNENETSFSNKKLNNDFESEDNQRIEEESLENNEKTDQDIESDKQFKEIKDKSQEEEKPSE